MTRDEYLNQLKNNLLSLTSDEQAEALQYYSDYFDEANDEQKVIAELGTPEELAKTIIDKFANALVDQNSKKSDESGEKKSSDVSSEALFYEFNKNDVKELILNFGAAEIVMISGNSYSVETRGITEESFNCSISSDGVLTVNNTRRLNINFWNHDRKRRIVPRILLTVPENAHVSKFKVTVGAGNFRTKNISLSFDSGFVDVGAGNMVLDSVAGGKFTARCGMGNLEVKGVLKGRVNLDCGMGCMKFNLSGNPEEYSYDAKVGLGDFRFNDDKRSGVCKSLENEVRTNHFSVNCGMGSVSVFVK